MWTLARLHLGPTRRPRVALGQCRRQAMLDTEGVYRVVACGDRTCVVEVVSAPGLAPGQQLSVSKAAAARMELLDDDPRPVAPSAPQGYPQVA